MPSKGLTLNFPPRIFSMISDLKKEIGCNTTDTISIAVQVLHAVHFVDPKAADREQRRLESQDTFESRRQAAMLRLKRAHPEASWPGEPTP